MPSFLASLTFIIGSLYRMKKLDTSIALENFELRCTKVFQELLCSISHFKNAKKCFFLKFLIGVFNAQVDVTVGGRTVGQRHPVGETFQPDGSDLKQDELDESLDKVVG